MSQAQPLETEITPTIEFADIQWGADLVRIEHQWIRSEDANAPLMIFLHEGLGSVSMWRDFPAQLCAALKCRGLVYSRPGYGQSTPRAEGEHWAPDFMHRQACEVLPLLLNKLGINAARDQLWLFGHSDGGSIALLYAALFPHAIKGAIVLAPHVFVEDISVTSIAEARAAYLSTDLRQKLSRHHNDPDSAFWGWNDIWLSPDFRAWRIDDELQSITCPLLVIQGLNDEYGSLQQLAHISRAVQHCTLLELIDCGHSPHKDQKDQVIKAAQRFYLQNR